jgi:hypothetical protein
MKQILPLRALFAFALSLSLLTSCKKEFLEQNQTQDQAAQVTRVKGIDIRENRTLAAGVTITAPSVVGVNQPFNILAEITCGRVSLERGYILDENNIKIYRNLTSETPDLKWEVVVNAQCYTSDLSWSGSLAEAGTYIYRTKHNASDGNCDGLGAGNTKGDCSFSGNQVYNFTIEGVNPCETEFTGEVVSCSSTRQVVYHFTSGNDENITIQGPLTNFTGADANVTVTGASLSVSQSPGAGSTSRNIKLEGAVTACQEVTITVSWYTSNTATMVTGDWSVKNAAGIELAPAVASLECEARRNSQ